MLQENRGRANCAFDNVNSMLETTIRKVRGRRIWDSRGHPTVETEIELQSGVIGRAIAPAGASTGSGEARDLRDGGKPFKGRGVAVAVKNVNTEIAQLLIGQDAADQPTIDRRLIELDGTRDKRRLGGNALVATSMAVLHASAAAAGLPLWQHLCQTQPVSLPLPEIQIFGGGAHASARLDVQDFMIVCLSARSFSEALDMTAEVYQAAGELLASRGQLQGVADEGGYWPAFSSNEEALKTLVEAIEAAGYVPGNDVAISLDIAASQLLHGTTYRLAREDQVLDTDGFSELLGRWIERYPIVSIEDPLSQDDPEGLRRFTAAHGDRLQIVGDDFLVTDAQRVRKAANSGACNAVLLKPNQAGTVTETQAALLAAQESGFGSIVSARSGETEDVTIVHLCVGWNAGQLKVGSFSRSERMAKWNEVLRIEESLGARAIYAGRKALDRIAACKVDMSIGLPVEEPNCN